MNTSLIARLAGGLLILALTAALGLVGSRPAETHAATAATALPWQHKGYTMAVWDANALNGADASLQQLASTGANSVTFVVTWYQTSSSSSSIFATGATATDASLIHAMQVARSLGLQVNLKPHVDSQDGAWRAYIIPTDATSWFNSYGSMVTHYADLLQQYGTSTSVLVIGTELISLSTNTTNNCFTTTTNYTNQWRTLIATLRAHFAGKLTYSGNWGAGCYAEEYTRIPFWDALDYIGISAYFPVGASGVVPTVASVNAYWSQTIASQLQPFQQRVGKPVMFTEVGYRSATGTAVQPFDAWDTWPFNAQEQVTCYEGFFQSFATVPWFVGTAAWAWNVNTGVSPTDIWYEVQNKPAQTTVQSWFSAGGSPGATATVPAAGPPSVTIMNPLTNQTYSGVITVEATATNASGLSFDIDGAAPTAMTYNTSVGRWQAALDTTRAANGPHNVTITNTGLNGTKARDTAWNVQFSNAITSTPTVAATPTVAIATPTSTPVPTSGPPSIVITNPVSNGTYNGTITVQASAANAATVGYVIDLGAEVPMTYNSANAVWQASLDTTALTNGNGHTVDVVNHGTNGTTVRDRAWSVNIANATTNPTATATPRAPSPTSTPTPTSTPPVAPPAISIRNPLSNGTYSGIITVQASAANAATVGYVIDLGAEVPMTYNSANALWQASLDTTRLTNGNGHTVDVINHGTNGTTVRDRAWSVNIAN